jgi:hypothetical protein
LHQNTLGPLGVKSTSPGFVHCLPINLRALQM